MKRTQPTPKSLSPRLPAPACPNLGCLLKTVMKSTPLPLLLVVQVALAAPETRFEKRAREKQEIGRSITWPLHEPLIFHLRRGDHWEDWSDFYARQHDPANIQRLADVGTRWERLHFYKPSAPFAVRLKQQIPGTVKAVKLFSPQSDEPQELTFTAERGRIAFTAPALPLYAMIVVENH